MKEHKDGTQVDLQLIGIAETPIADHAIFLNAAKCPDCREVLISMNKSDFQRCDCDNVAIVQGGRESLSRLFLDHELIELAIRYNPDGDGSFYTEGDIPK